MRLLIPLLLLAILSSARAEQYDVLVYGSTPAGIAAAVAAASDGEKVLLVSPEPRVGGMMANGLSHTDFRTFESLTGAFGDFAQRVVKYYGKEFGERAAEVCFRGTHAEPKVNQLVFEQMLAEHANITVQRGWAVEAVKCSSDASGDAPGQVKTVEIALFADAEGERHSLAARYFIDATYEGDLLAAAGVEYRVGREGKGEYGESLAPDQPDAALQGYNFRMVMTKHPTNRVPVTAPPAYRRDTFAEILPLFSDGRLTAAFGMQPQQVFKAQVPPLPHGKYDVNDMSHGPVRLSLPGVNDPWPDGGGGVAIREGATDAISAPPFSRTGLAISRAKIFQEHLRWNVGLLFFLQNDPEVPEKVRAEAKEWGWCQDEFADRSHLPEQLYVREARRMVGAYIYTEGDLEFASGDARATLHTSSIAIGDYGPNCHGTEHEGAFFGGKHTGEFYKPVAPYQIPYGVIVPKNFDNFLVPVAVSASHVGFCTLRFEPIWMELGQAAGHAIHLARKERASVQGITVAKLQARLHEAGAGTIYVSDVPPGSPDFAAVQWWGTAGGFHGLATTPEAKDLRGKNIVGQYFEAFPNHAAELDRPLDERTAAQWTALAAKLGIDTEKLAVNSRMLTRGEWIRAAFRAAHN